jgi:hypothetical protein
MTQTSAYRIIRGVSIRAGINAGHKEVRGDVSGVWSHWARSMRASCLGSEYKWNKSQLDNWFGWEDLGATSKRYAHEDDEDQWAKMEAGAEHIKV